MSKEEYILLREQEEIPVSLFFDYYLEVCKDPKVKTLEEFEKVFPEFMGVFGNQSIISHVGIKTITFEGVANRVYDYFNKKFENTTE